MGDGHVSAGRKRGHALARPGLCRWRARAAGASRLGRRDGADAGRRRAALERRLLGRRRGRDRRQGGGARRRCRRAALRHSGVQAGRAGRLAGRRFLRVEGDGRRAMTRAAPDWDALQGAIEGEVVLPDSHEYESLRRPQIARFHELRPRAVVLCRTPADVSETIAVARRSGLPTAVRSGGHCFAGRSSSEGIVIDVTPMRSGSVSGGVATVGAGARLGDLYDSPAEHGLTIAAGCGPTVGIAGLTLGGGLGILGRRYGLTCDQLLAAQVVLADGSVVDCDEHHDEDLFWALRGAGGGNFGVVTSLVFRAVPAPAATSFHLVWPHSRAAAVLQAWQAWGAAGPDELAASLLVTAPADVEAPPLVHVFGAMLGTEADTAGLLDELVARTGADP